MSDLDIQTGPDFDIDEVDDMPQFVTEIEGVYSCDLSLSRDTGEKNDKPYDYLIFSFIILEEIEAKKDYGVKEEDMVYIRYPLIPSKKDIENGERSPFGLRMAKPHLNELRKALNTTGQLEDIITNSQGVKCDVVFSTRTTQGKNAEGESVTYKNINIKKLTVR